MANSNQPHDPAAAMRALRQMALTRSPSELGVEPTAEFPLVYGALIDLPWLEDGGTVTITSLHDGNASLYTTGTFGIIGGYAHERVRNAATAFVSAAQNYHDDAIPTSDFPYPQADRVRIYLLTYHGVRVIDTDRASLEAGENPYYELLVKGNDVITELRKIAMPLPPSQ